MHHLMQLPYTSLIGCIVAVTKDVNQYIRGVLVRVVSRDGAGSSWYVLASCSDLAGSRLSNTFSCFSVVFLNVHVFEFPSES